MATPTYKVFTTFDRAIFKKNWRAINESPMKKAGLRVRRAAISRIRKAKYGRGTKKDPTGRKTFERPSKPGKPPKSRAPGHPFRRIYSVPIHFGTGVMIGPVGFDRNMVTTPELHEFGKRAIRFIRFQKSIRQRDKRTGRFRKNKRLRPQYKKVSVKYPARPFMAPALERIAPSLPRMWKNSLSQ